jgi:hypothetical protein
MVEETAATRGDTKRPAPDFAATLESWWANSKSKYKPVERVGVIAMIDALGIRHSGTGAAPDRTLTGLMDAKRESEWATLFSQAIGIVVKGLTQAASGNRAGATPTASQKVRLIGLGDTLIVAVYGKNSPREQLREIAQTVTYLMSFGMSKGLFFRGAISYGSWWELDPPQADSIHLLGPAVDEAAEWRDQTEWVGCALTPHAGFEWERPEEFDPDDPTAAFIDYPVPVKPGEPNGVLKWALNWPGLGHLSRRALLGSFASVSIPKSAASKYVNSIAFYDEAWKRLSKIGRKPPPDPPILPIVSSTGPAPADERKSPQAAEM